MDHRLRSDLVVRGRARAAKFRWSRAAELTLDALDQAVARFTR
jgi:hypothetical protein